MSLLKDAHHVRVSKNGCNNFVTFSWPPQNVHVTMARKRGYKGDDSVDALKVIDHLSDIARIGQKIDSKSDTAKILLESKDEIIMGYKDMKGLVKNWVFH